MQRLAPKHTAFRLELLTDPNLPCGGPGRSLKGTCALTEFSVEAAPLADEKKKAVLKIVSASSRLRSAGARTGADLQRPFQQPPRSPAASSWRLMGMTRPPGGSTPGRGGANQDRKAVFQLEKPIDCGRRCDPELQAAAKPRWMEQRRPPEQQSRPLPHLGHRRPRAGFGRSAAPARSRHLLDSPRSSQ